MAAADLAPLLVSGGARAEDVEGYAKIDHDRGQRTGFPEVIFGEGKSAAQITKIFESMVRKHEEQARPTGGGGMSFRPSPIVATRVARDKWAAISEALPAARYHELAQIVYIVREPQVGGHTKEASTTREEGTSKNSLEGSPSSTECIGKVAVLSAGTSDLAIAEEAAVLAELAGAEVTCFHDGSNALPRFSISCGSLYR